jgi:2-polyprenyl-3-methyl-5-hydroxy-6-metoxy-1,4-benzoquinol methylase
VSTYQPLWIDGQTVGDSLRDAERRYAMIHECLEGLVSPGFTLLDVGAQSGYFSVRFADEMGAQATAIDGEAVLMEGLQAMAPHGVSGVMKFLRPRDLKIFRPVDVGLCLSVLHHVDWWETMLDELMGLCRILFVECAMPGEEIGKDPELLDEQHRTVAGFPGATLAGWTPGYDARVERPMYLIPGRR